MTRTNQKPRTPLTLKIITSLICLGVFTECVHLLGLVAGATFPPEPKFVPVAQAAKPPSVVHESWRATHPEYFGGKPLPPKQRAIVQQEASEVDALDSDETEQVRELLQEKNDRRNRNSGRR